MILTLFSRSYSSVNQIAYDWAGGNWYFLDDSKEVIFLCQERKNHAKLMCLSIVSVRLSKPRGIALDPSEGIFNFFVFVVLHSLMILHTVFLSNAAHCNTAHCYQNCERKMHLILFYSKATCSSPNGALHLRS